MRDDNRPDSSGGQEDPARLEPVSGASSGTDDALPDNTASDEEPYDESLTEEIAALIDDGRTYAQAELTFRKTQASLAGQKVGVIAGLGVLAIILLHLTFIALAVGMVIALEPLVTIWGAIAIVVGVLLLGVIALGLKLRSTAKSLADLFKDESV